MRKCLLAVSLVSCVSYIMPTSEAIAASLTNQNQSEPSTVTLYAAGSLRGALSEVADDFTKEYGNPVKTEFGPSGTLRGRLENGEQADVFASADIGNPLKLYQEGLSGPVVNFTSNRMTLVVKPGLSVTPDNLLNILLDSNIKLGTSTPISDPSGDYAQEIFRKADTLRPGSFQTLDAKALRLVGGPSSPPVPDGKNNLVYFLEETKQADVFLAYYTSALSALKISPDLQVVELPDNLAVKADYGLTVLKDASPDGKKLAEYILSPFGQKILTKYGFSSESLVSVPESQNWGGMVLGVGIALVLKKTSASSKKRKLKKVATCHD
ncbi:molybdate ABC transporter substrate-binding protein [Brasilonema octagenarum]|uniref:Molybdenum ABC transporter substrate-binding protein n=1 Tax=Brasilonema octagenarum UFV-OR1 TaxID=417115 RepID=A0ABX1MAA1_9CYAN|nr:molybdate ABC transporter substrate-binding protein [Brasilonema octagenarum]NMF63744.1 molybdenum ABC transporter substrate-binding protein [Brasilonema octagenarum UFV-OR1]